jgi:hypothetical protein
MSITSGERHDLHTRLSEVLGENQANILMEHLPPVGWADVATKRDLDTQGVLVRQEVETLGAELRGEITNLGSELRGEITNLGTELRGEITNLGTSLGARIDRESIDRKADMDVLMSGVLREQRLFLTAILLGINTLLAISTVVG